MNAQFEDLKNSITSSRIENINYDDYLLSLLKENVRYINRRVADTELDVHALKKNDKAVTVHASHLISHFDGCPLLGL